MGLFDFLRRPAQPAAEKKTTFDPAKFGVSLTGANTGAGVVINEQTALQIPVALACGRLIAQGVAALDLHVGRAGPGGTWSRAPEVPQYDLLARRPNAWQTAFEFIEMLTLHAIFAGNGYALINRVGGRADELIPITPALADVTPDPRGGRRYRVTFAGGAQVPVAARDIFHLSGMSWDGVRGLRIVAAAREVLGLSAAALGAQARSFGNGARIPGYWTTEETLEEESAKRLRDMLIEATTGTNQWKSPVLDLGLSYKPISQNFDEAQLIETRKHQVSEVCAMFGVAPAVLGISDQTQAFASVESMQRWHLVHTLGPWLKRWTQRLDLSVLDGPGPLSARFDTRDLTKATLKERAESYRSLVEMGVMTRNEAREHEGLAPLPGLDEPLTPLNMGGPKDAPQD